MAKRTFQRGSGCFKCRSCGKMTRDVDDNGDVQLCPLCNSKAMNGNSLSDAGYTGDAWAVFAGCRTVAECDARQRTQGKAGMRLHMIQRARDRVAAGYYESEHVRAAMVDRLHRRLTGETIVAKQQNGTEIAAKLRRLTVTLIKRIENLRASRLTNTPKRQCQDMANRCEANNLERVVRALEALADGWERGTVPAELQALRNRAQIEPLVTRIIEHPSYYVVCESDRWRNNSPLAQRLRAYVAEVEGNRFAAQDAEKAKRERIRSLEESVRFCPIPGFFPTPPALVARMIEHADIRPGMTCLEPSAGKGDIAEALRGCGCEVECIELNQRLAEICEAKGLKVKCGDFLDTVPDRKYDRILMNPPFERGQYMRHVRHAFEFLAPGGRLVAIVSAGYAFNRQAAGFREWLEEVGAVVEPNPSDAFQDRDAFRKTGVSTHLLIIDAPETANEQGVEKYLFSAT